MKVVEGSEKNPVENCAIRRACASANKTYLDLRQLRKHKFVSIQYRIYKEINPYFAGSRSFHPMFTSTQV